MGNSDDGLFIHAVVVKHLIPFLHGAKEIAGLIVSDTVPDRLLLLQKEGEGIFGGLLFDQPVVHAGILLVQIRKKLKIKLRVKVFGIHSLG